MPHDPRSAAERHYSHLSAMQAYEQAKDSDVDFGKLPDNTAEILEPPKCENCGQSLRGLSMAGLVVEFAGYEYCSGACVEHWMDKQQERAG